MTSVSFVAYCKIMLLSFNDLVLFVIDLEQCNTSIKLILENFLSNQKKRYKSFETMRTKH